MAKGKNMIFTGPADGPHDKTQTIEGQCLTASLLPGTVVSQTATGLQTNTNAATVSGQEMLIADKNSMMGKTVDEAWTQNENMVAGKLRSGEFANVLVADGNNITSPGTALALNGSGKFAIANTATDFVMCYSDEIINVSGSDALVRVRSK